MEQSTVYALTVQRFYRGPENRVYQQTDENPIAGIYSSRQSAIAMAQQYASAWQGTVISKYTLERIAKGGDFEGGVAVLDGKTPVCTYLVRRHIVQL